MEILPQLMVNSLITGSIYALAASGLALSYGLLRILNFAHGHLMMVGAYFFYLFAEQLGYGILLSSTGTILLSSILGVIVYFTAVAPFLNFSSTLTFVSTLALGTILESLVAIFFGVNVKSLSIGFGESYDFGSVFITPTQIYIIVSAFAVLGFLGVLIHGTPMGRQLRALTQNQAAAATLGIHSARWSCGIFVLSSVLAAFAGVMVGCETNLQPTMGSLYTIKAFAAMILGGLGNIWGTIAGSFILGFIENISIGLDLGDYSIPAGYKDAFAYVIILGMLLLRPQGLFAKRSRRV